MRRLDEDLLKFAYFLALFGSNEIATGDAESLTNVTYLEITAAGVIGIPMQEPYPQVRVRYQDIAAEVEELAQVEGHEDGFTFPAFGVDEPIDDPLPVHTAESAASPYFISKKSLEGTVPNKKNYQKS
jgi:hypothetical protein